MEKKKSQQQRNNNNKTNNKRRYGLEMCLGGLADVRVPASVICWISDGTAPALLGYR